MNTWETVAVLWICLCVIWACLASTRRHQRMLRRQKEFKHRDTIWFSDQHREERAALIRSFQQKAAKGWDARKVDRGSDESQQRAHLQAVSKTGTRP